MDAHNRQRVKVYEAIIAQWEASLADASELRAEQLRLDIADLRSWINTIGGSATRLTYEKQPTKPTAQTRNRPRHHAKDRPAPRRLQKAAAAH